MDELNDLFVESDEQDPFLQELRIVMSGDNPIAMIGRLLAFGAENVAEIQLRVETIEAAQNWVKGHMVALKREAARRNMTPAAFITEILDDVIDVYGDMSDADIEEDRQSRG